MDFLPLFAAIWSASFLSCASETPKAIYATAKQSTFIIETFDTRGIPLSLGTGFAVRSNLLASNCHVIRGANTATAKILDSERSFPIEAIVRSDLRADLVLLRIKAAVAPLVIETNLNWSVGDSVYALGNPHGLAGTFSAGIISATRELGFIHYLQITAPISPGNSGGPVLSSEGRVVGVATAAIKDAQNLNFAVSVQHLATLLSEPPREDSFASFVIKHESFARSETPSRAASSDGIAVTSFEWTPFHGLDAISPFSFTVFNGLRRPVKNVLVALSFLNTDLQPVDTKIITISETIAPGSGLRASGSVDASVARLNRLYDHLGINPPKPSKFFLGTNSVVLKWRGSDVAGYRKVPLINGHPSSEADYNRLFAEAQGRMRVMRAVSFEYGD